MDTSLYVMNVAKYKRMISVVEGITLTVICIYHNRHKIKVTRESLLNLHSHTVEVKLWNSVDKLSARARYDRPKAFRLPAMKTKGSNQLLEESAGLTSRGERPEKLPVLYQDKILNSRRRKRKGSTLKTSETDSSDVPIESTECLTSLPAASAETTKQPVASPGSQTLSTSDHSPRANLTQTDRSSSVQLPLSSTITLTVPTMEPREPWSQPSALKGTVDSCSIPHVFEKLLDHANLWQ